MTKTRVANFLVGFLASVLAFYAVCAFVSWDWGIWSDMNEWENISRSLFLYMIVAVCGFVGAFCAGYELIFEGDKT